MKPGEVIEIIGKVEYKTSFGSVTVGPKKGSPRRTVVAKVLVVPADLYGDDLLKWLHSLKPVVSSD